MMRVGKIAKNGSLLLLCLMVLPFALYAWQFAWGGLTDTLSQPSYIQSDDGTANLAVFSHMILGGLITLVAPLQLIASLRVRFPAWHRWSGRIITVAALITAIGGLIYIARQGTIGGWPMDAGFTLYGLLMLICAAQTIRFARARAFERHRAWALRLFWLILGSWLYRVHYGLWYAATGGLWSDTDAFRGAFDLVQNFAFCLPYLIGVEIYLRHEKARRTTT